MNNVMNGWNQLLARITRRWPVKVLSVIAAIILFVFHRLDDIQERFFSAPLRVETSSGLVPSSPYPHNIRITLRGGANSIYPVAEGDIEVYLDLSRYREPGFYKTAVQVRKKGTAVEAEGLEIHVDPLEISLELDVGASKSVPVKPNFHGNPENGYELVSYVLDPDYVVIDGPRSHVASIVEMGTDPVDLGSRNADFAVHLKVESPNSLVTIRGDGMTEFRCYIREAILIRSFDGMPVASGGLKEGLLAAVEPETGSVRVEGVQRLLENFRPPEDFLSVDLSGVNAPGVYRLPVQAALPAEFILRGQEPLEAVVRVVSGGPEEEDGQ